ncbi:MAG: glycosyltransferase 87 family protein, partial [Candidatus Sulfotelmatobacter sp.]
WWVLAACAVVNLLLWLRFLHLRLSLPALVILFALVLTSVPVMQNLSILQPFLLPACFLAGAAVAAASGRLFLAGALLAAATVKPQICLLPLAWFTLWLCSDWKRRRPLLFGFAVTLAALVLASEGLLPGWLRRYPEVLRSYAQYTKARSFLGVLLSSPLDWLVAVLALAAVVDFCWRARRQPAESAPFALALSSVLTLTILIIPAVVQPFNHILLLPVVLLAIRHWQELRQCNLVTRTATSVFCLAAFLPWLLAVVTVANPFASNHEWLLKVWSLPLAASMALPFAAFGMLILLRKLTAMPAVCPPATSVTKRQP